MLYIFQLDQPIDSVAQLQLLIHAEMLILKFGFEKVVLPIVIESRNFLIIVKLYVNLNSHCLITVSCTIHLVQI